VADERGKTGSSRDAGSKDRRLLLRIGAATAIGALVLGRAASDLLAPDRRARVSVVESCLGCTGCAAVCPEGSVSIAPGGIEIDQERCTRCGYCVAVCPTEGLVVHREDGRA
jgi:ferredoxin